MSGIVALLQLDGAPVDAALLERMTASLAFRAPDGARARSAGPLGLGHALLRTGDRERAVEEPLTLDGETWIAADARIDGRAELVSDLRSAGRVVDEDASSAELILHAYAAWGDASPARLLGDFAFALWDAPQRRLFCARDLFGVKPLYHARAGAALVVSNTLDAVRLHPGVSDALDEAAVADFLVHGHPQALDLTIWRDVRALPPAHALVAGDGEVRVRRWGALPAEAEPLRYRRVADYVGHYLAVMGDAVRDRLPDGGAAIFLSGGRDSTTIAALAREAADRGERRTELRGYTAVYDRLMPDEERRYTAMAAEALRIPVRFTAVDGYEAFERWETPALLRPQPTDAVLGAIEADQLAQAAGHARVLLTGQGGDAALRETRSRLTKLVVSGHLLRALREAAEYAWWHRRLPRPGVRSWRADRTGASRWHARVPAWIDPDFARRAGLRERVAAWNAQAPPPHPLRPEAFEQLSSPLWPALFAAYDPGATRVPVEVRHPYFDLRVARFLLSVPPAQWYNDKGLPRMGMRGRLPDAFLRRPKTPLSGDPLEARLRDRGAGWLGGRALGPAVARFVDPEKVPRTVGGRGAPSDAPLWEEVRPLALSLWLSAHGFDR